MLLSRGVLDCLYRAADERLRLGGLRCVDDENQWRPCAATSAIDSLEVRPPQGRGEPTAEGAGTVAW